VYVETLRVERARTLLEDGAESLEAGPAAYRERFRLAA
jgi:transcriptional regulator GlxA family with amidase domain